MHSKRYSEVVSWLFEQFPSYQQIGASAYKPTLENTLKLAEIFGNPQNDLQFIHVAGSNGKGSVCSYCASILSEAGFKVGLFTSPHIKDFRERIRINGTTISEESVIEFVDRIQSLELDFKPSFFEMSFVMSLWYFKQVQVDIALIETGMGGRLDSTNIISPLCTAITSISLEHTAILGDSIEKIAFEKAGIIKENVPMIIPEKIQESAKKVIEDQAKHQNAPLMEARKSAFKIENPYLPDFQLYNLGIVEKILDVIENKGFETNDRQIEAGIKNVARNSGYRGRMELISLNPDVIYDVSHNPDGIAQSLEAIKLGMNSTGKLHIVYGSSSDKDLSEIANLFPSETSMYFTSFDHPRAASKSQLLSSFGACAFQSVAFFENPYSAYEDALKSASQEDTLVVMGSFFLLEHFF